MAVSVYPAQGGDGFKLRRVITTTGLVDLGQARNAYVVLAGGGGGGSGGRSSNSHSGAGGGGAGALGGTMLMKEFHATIGAGGTGGAVGSVGGNGGTTYLTLYASTISQSHGNGLIGSYICATGGQGATQASTNYGTSFENVGNPTISGWTTFNKLFGSSGAGSGREGGSNSVSNNPLYNYNSSNLTTTDALQLSANWTLNNLSYLIGQIQANGALGQSQFGGWGSILSKTSDPLQRDAAQSTTDFPLYIFNRNTGVSTAVLSHTGGRASNGEPPLSGGSGYWTGGGGAGDSQGAGVRGAQGGSARAFRGGLGGTNNGGAAGGAGGGAGIVANGGDGGNATSGNSGTSGVGGLGGGGGAGGNSNSGDKAGGAGGQGAIALYW